LSFFEGTSPAPMSGAAAKERRDASSALGLIEVNDDSRHQVDRNSPIHYNHRQ
jgi:hypothetical protein